MKDFRDRVSTNPNQYRIVKADGSSELVTMEKADNPTVIGTPLNREAFMALQGFQQTRTVFNSDGSISEYNQNNEELKTVFNADGSITKTFTSVDGVSVSLKTIFKEDGSIEEVFV